MPFVNFSNQGHNTDRSAGQPQSGDAPDTPLPEEASENTPNEDVETGWNELAIEQATSCSHCCERSARKTESDEVGIIPLGTSDQNGLVEALPAREILIQIVDHFCISFHHWIPFLHKAKCQAEVQRAEISPNFAPILHALVAVVLPRMSELGPRMDHEQIHRQTRVSKNLALQFSVMNASLRSLQTLLILVFEQVSARTWIEVLAVNSIAQRRCHLADMSTDRHTRANCGLPSVDHRARRPPLASSHETTRDP